MIRRHVMLWTGVVAAALCAGAPAAGAQEQYGVVFRTTDGGGAHADRVRIQSSVGLSRVLLVDAYLDSAGQPIRNVGAPVLAGDAASKGYVDAAVGAISFSSFAQIADAAGAVQFTATGPDTLRLAAGSGLAVSFNAAAKEASFAIPAGAIADAHLSGGINPAKIAGTALVQATAFAAAAASDAAVAGTYDALNVQLKPASVTDAEIAGTISAAKIEDVWVDASGDTMSGQLVASAGLALPSGQQLRYRDAADPKWALSTTSVLGELYVDITGESDAAETRAWRLRDTAGASPTTRFSVDMLTGAVSATGPLSMGANAITNLAPPNAATDAATKAYVDSAVGAGMGITSLNGQTGPLLTLATAAGSGLSVTAAANTVTVASDLLNAATPNDYVHWNVLAGIPAGFADGIDDNTAYAAGSGLTLAGTTFAVSFGTTAGTAAAGNHNHDPIYVDVAGDTMTGSLGIGQTPAMDEKLIVVGTQGSIIVR